MSIERELREIKAEVEKLERVAGSKVAKSTVELEDLTDLSLIHISEPTRRS